MSVHLNDISKVYQSQIAEKAIDPDDITALLKARDAAKDAEKDRKDAKKENKAKKKEQKKQRKQEKSDLEARRKAAKEKQQERVSNLKDRAKHAGKEAARLNTRAKSRSIEPIRDDESDADAVGKLGANIVRGVASTVDRGRAAVAAANNARLRNKMKKENQTEQFIQEVEEMDPKKDKLEKVIDVMRGKNKIEVNPKLQAEDTDVKIDEKWESAAEANRKYDRARKAAARRAAERNRKRDAGELNDGRRERETYTSSSGQRMHYKGYKAEELELEAKVDQGLDDEAKEDTRNYRKFGTKHNQAGTARFRRELHRSRRGDKKIKGQKVPVEEAKVDKVLDATRKATERNKRNTPPGANRKFDTSVFITRKEGESLDSARTRKRREAHAAKRGVKESVTIQDAKGRDFLEIIDIIKPEPMKSPKNNIPFTEENKKAKTEKVIQTALENERKRKNALQIQKIIGTQ